MPRPAPCCEGHRRAALCSGLNRETVAKMYRTRLPPGLYAQGAGGVAEAGADHAGSGDAKGAGAGPLKQRHTAKRIYERPLTSMARRSIPW